MKPTLQHLNLVGVLILATCCLLQWRDNRTLNLERRALEGVRLEHLAQLAERDRALQGCNADLERFRDHLARAGERLRESEASLAATGQQLAQLRLEREQLLSRLTNWAEAVAARDAQLQLAAEQLARLGTERNETVQKFNELAAKYNAAVQDLNDRTHQFNELAGRSQKLNRP